MIRPVSADSLRKSLIGLINTDLDFLDLLEEMAVVIGKNLDLKACLLVTGSEPSTLNISGFWQKQAKKWKGENFSGLEFFLKKERAIGLTEIPGGKLDWWETIAPLSGSWGIGTHFRSLANGVIIIGADETSVNKSELLTEISDLIGIAYGTGQKNSLPQNEKEALSHLIPRELITTGGNSLIIRLHELLRQQLEQQRQLNEMKDEIIAAISDRARNPLATMRMAMNALQDEKRHLPASSRENYWKILDHEWQTLNNLIDNIVLLKRLEAGEISFHPQHIDINSLLEGVTRNFKDNPDDRSRKTLELKIDGDILTLSKQLHSDPIHLQSIIQELLTNAYNFSYPRTTIKVYLKKTSKDKLAILVSNKGLGIGDNEKNEIFEPFRRGKGITERAIAGTGIGLAVVKRLTDLIGAEIEVNSRKEADTDLYETVFTLTLPLTDAKNKGTAR